MRRLDENPIDPEIAAQLDAIDATLAGEPVDPQYAELAELALMLAAERPAIEPEFAAAMDTRVREQFSGAGAMNGVRGVAAPSLAQRVTSWLPQVAGLAAGLAAVAAIVVVIGSAAALARRRASSVLGSRRRLSRPTREFHVGQRRSSAASGAGVNATAAPARGGRRRSDGSSAPQCAPPPAPAATVARSSSPRSWR